MRLLFVDGDSVRRQRIRAALAGDEDAGFVVTEASGPEQLRAACEAQCCVLVRCEDAARDVAPVVDALRNDAGEITVPVVALLDGDRALGAEALRAGACDWVTTEALAREGIARVVRSAVERGQLARALRESEQRLRMSQREVVARRVAEEALLDVDRRKDRFVDTLSHELRRPLTTLRLSAAIVRRLDGSDPTLTHYREVIARQVTFLTRLVDDMLDLSNVARGKLSLHCERLDLGAVITEAVEDCHDTLDARGHTLTVSLPTEPLLVDGDRTRLSQIVSNLLVNAAKYTDDGGLVQVTLTALADGSAQISVRDNGMGIDAGALPQLFDPYFQAEQSRARADRGLGLGLPLVRSLVELHGGAVHALSAGRGKGSEFVVRIPLAATVTRPVQRRTTAPALRTAV